MKKIVLFLAMMPVMLLVIIFTLIGFSEVWNYLLDSDWAGILNFFLGAFLIVCTVIAFITIGYSLRWRTEKE